VNKKKLRIKLESFNKKLLNISAKRVIEKINEENLDIIGPIALPTKKRIYCVLTSPHVNKDAREHFEIKTYKRILDIYYNAEETDPKNKLIKIILPSGVKAKIK